MTVHNPLNNRDAHICQLPDGRFGIQITEVCAEGEVECTSFINRARRIEQVIQYLKNRGFDI